MIQFIQRRWSFLLFLPWSMLLVVAGTYTLLWKQLPAVLVVHINSQGLPDGWVGREWIIPLALFFQLLILARYTWRLADYGVQRRSLPALLPYYAGVALVSGVFLWLAWYNI